MILIEKQVRMGAEKKEKGYYEGKISVRFFKTFNVLIFLHIQNGMIHATGSQLLLFH